MIFEIKQYFGETKTELFLKNELFLKDPEDEKKTHTSFRKLYQLGMRKQKGLLMGTVQYLGRGHRPFPGPVTAKMTFFLMRKIYSWQ